ncbi:hypothetical protein B0H13DRAFT_2285210 [Mycena leptocephala]|nr:hypothetical protein B0H13DRAFT_2285210 [Mycena leptocephala]
MKGAREQSRNIISKARTFFCQQNWSESYEIFNQSRKPSENKGSAGIAGYSIGWARKDAAIAFVSRWSITQLKFDAACQHFSTIRALRTFINSHCGGSLEPTAQLQLKFSDNFASDLAHPRISQSDVTTAAYERRFRCSRDGVNDGILMSAVNMFILASDQYAQVSNLLGAQRHMQSIWSHPFSILDFRFSFILGPILSALSPQAKTYSKSPQARLLSR